jgi:hypothetical protein
MTNKSKSAKSLPKSKSKKPAPGNKKVIAPISDDVEITETAKRPSRKLTFQTWISITNLILTAIIGIGVAAYLQYSQQNFESELQAKEQSYQTQLQQKDEESQKQIIELQRQLGISNIFIGHLVPAGVYGGHIIRVTNNGPATAKNIRVAICIDSMNPVWEESLNDISNFDFKEYANPSFDLTREDVVSSCGFAFKNGGNNAVIITIATLPPNEDYGIAVSLSNNIELKKVETKVLAHVLTPKSLAIIPIPGNVLLNPPTFIETLIYEFTVARFQAQTSCENCVVTSGEDQSVPLVLVVDSSGAGYSSEQPITSETDTNYVTDIERTITYDIPVESTAPTSAEIYFLLQKDKNGFDYYQTYK